MLLEFSFSNWKSFADETYFSMVAGRERQHENRLAKLEPYANLRLLPVSAVYGGNASGKSNFVKALSFCEQMVSQGPRPEEPIPVLPFCLDSGLLKQPTRFRIRLFAGNDRIYELSFSVNRDRVLEESLSMLHRNPSGNRELYSRQDGKMTFHKSLPEQDRLKFVGQGTQDNQLFLSNAVSQKVQQEDIQAVYGWFRNNLLILGPEFRASLWSIQKEKSKPLICSLLSQLDTGIVNFEETEIGMNELSLSGKLIEKLSGKLAVSKIPALFLGNEKIIRLENGKLRAARLGFTHRAVNGGEQLLSLEDESDGSLRIIDLLPMLVTLAAKDSRTVVVFDEIDRSLHTLLLLSLLQTYLELCSKKKRTQLLFTTHDVMLLDQSLLRRDELWLTERQEGGKSKLYSFVEFDVRNDRDIRKSYLQGRMGGIPFITLDPDLLTEASEQRQE